MCYDLLCLALFNTALALGQKFTMFLKNPICVVSAFIKENSSKDFKTIKILQCCLFIIIEVKRTMNCFNNEMQNKSCFFLLVKGLQMKMKLKQHLAFDYSVNWHLSFEMYELVEVDRVRLRCDFTFWSVCNLYWQSNCINWIFQFGSFCSFLQANNFSGVWCKQI